MEAVMTQLILLPRRIAPTMVGLGLFIILALPPVRAALEATLMGHMLVQIPLLVLAGWLLVAGRGSILQSWNANGIPGLLLALFAMAFWSIPRWLDAALSEPLWEIIKFITVPLLVGLPLAMSWPRLSDLARGFVWANAISMLAFMGWLYIAAPVRVCNNYLVDQQVAFGYSAMLIAVAIALYWTGKGFFGSWEHKATD